MLYTIVALTTIVTGVTLIRSLRNQTFSTNPRHRLAGTTIGFIGAFAGSLMLVDATSWIAQTQWHVVWEALAITTAPLLLCAYTLGLGLSLCASLLDACAAWLIDANPATQAGAAIAATAVIVLLPRTRAGRLGSTITRNALVIATLVTFVIAGHRLAVDGLEGWTASMVLPNDTRYASGYSDKAFRHVRTGMTHDEVRALLGTPLHASLVYGNDVMCDIWLKDGSLDRKLAELRPRTCKILTVTPAASANDIYRALGTPSAENWIFSDSPADTNYSQRIVRFKDGHVVSRLAEFYFD